MHRGGTQVVTQVSIEGGQWVDRWLTGQTREGRLGRREGWAGGREGGWEDGAAGGRNTAREEVPRYAQRLRKSYQGKNAKLRPGDT